MPMWCIVRAQVKKKATCMQDNSQRLGHLHAHVTESISQLQENIDASITDNSERLQALEESQLQEQHKVDYRSYALCT